MSEQYILHNHVRKRFPRNPYTVTNIDDTWEMDLADLVPSRNTTIIINTS